MKKVVMKKAFTMIEMVFVIVIIGILAAVAVPHLASGRDEAKGGICAGEVASIVLEITTNYAKLGYTAFQNLTIADLSNVKTGITGTEVTDTGILEAGTLGVKDGITYKCEGSQTATLAFVTSGRDYNLTVTPQANSTTPVGMAAARFITQNFKTTLGSEAHIPLSY
jgi:general secretion pathway protein G